MARTPLSDEEVQKELKSKTTGELLAFREKLRQMDVPQAWALRFFIIKELAYREFIARWTPSPGKESDCA